MVTLVNAVFVNLCVCGKDTQDTKVTTLLTASKLYLPRMQCVRAITYYVNSGIGLVTQSTAEQTKPSATFILVKSYLYDRRMKTNLATYLYGIWCFLAVLFKTEVQVKEKILSSKMMWK